MYRIMKKWLLDEQGSSILLVALMMVLLLGMVALVIDGGTLYMTKSHLQKVADAAALSGAQELTNQQENVEDVIAQILMSHKEEGSLLSTHIEMGNKVTVQLKKEVSLGFAKVLGFSSAPVEVKATAELRTMGKAVGAAPLGIDDSIPLEYFKTYTLKVDETEVDHGDFGVLALGGPGADTYLDNLINGYRQEIKVGDIIETESGNITGKTRVGVTTRIHSCPYLDGGYNHRDCPRILLIPVYKPYNYVDGYKLKEIKITGFAYFYVTEFINDRDKSIKGMFIKRAGTGISDLKASNSGAYAIRLIE